ncbi:MAG: hypothetical protein JWN46_1099, partial [Acidimicrobiales bacterium]|nr:hypothetical protein [Acidimicrobiales bacterium]
DVVGSASLVLPVLAVGDHVLTAVYSGDASFTGSSTTLTHTVAKSPTAVALASSPGRGIYGKAITLTARVTRTSTGAGATGAVTVNEGTQAIASVALTGGAGSVALSSLTVGPHTLDVTYPGDVGSLPTSGSIPVIVDPIPTVMQLASTAQPSVYGQSATISATVTTAAGAIPTVGSVTFSEGSALLGTATLYFGKFSLSLATLPAGTHTVLATYAGGSNLLASVATIVQVVRPAVTTISVTSTANPTAATSGASLQAVVTAVAPGGGTPTGTVTFSEGGVVLSTLNASFFGRWAFALGGLKVGSHTITAAFTGTGSYLGASTAITQVVDVASTVVTATSSSSPAGAYAGGSIQAIVAPVAPAIGSPTGSVTFSEGGVALARPDPFFNQYGMQLALLPVGTHVITVTFTGAGGFASSSTSITQVIVKAAPIVTVMSSANPSTQHDGSYLTVRIASGIGSAANTDGSVAFTDGGSTIAVAPVNGGVANLSYFDLAPGRHVIGATYSGNDSFTATTVPSVTEVVNAAVPAPTPDPSCAAAIGIGDSRLMNMALLGRWGPIALGVSSPLKNAPILVRVPNLSAILGFRYGTFGHTEYVKAQKARCPSSREYFTLLGPNHLNPSMAGDTQAWDPIDTAEMYAMFDLMTQSDAYGPGGNVVVGSFVYGPKAPDYVRLGAAAHDQAVRDYVAAHPDRNVRLLPLDAAPIPWSTDGIHPTVPANTTGAPAGQDLLAQQLMMGLAQLDVDLAATPVAGSTP